MNNLILNKVTALVFIFFLILTSAVSSKDTGLIFVSNEKSHEVMVIDPDIMPDNTAFILDLAYIQPVFTNIPGFGTVFVRDLDQDSNARIGKAIYMEMGFEFGPPSYHCKIQAVS